MMSGGECLDDTIQKLEQVVLNARGLERRFVTCLSLPRAGEVLIESISVMKPSHAVRGV